VEAEGRSRGEGGQNELTSAFSSRVLNSMRSASSGGSHGRVEKVGRKRKTTRPES